jgi:hypothetical protein
MPPLKWGPPTVTYSGAEKLPTVPGPDVSKHQFGICDECGVQIMTDASGTPMRACK